MPGGWAGKKSLQKQLGPPPPHGTALECTSTSFVCGHYRVAYHTDTGRRPGIGSVLGVLGIGFSVSSVGI
ncbi:hypothetical protein THAOC_36735 [Thalassiosira oceanica]|uniref:Uncharacterized protein n=1 Tax=Thalassiosira oceanica TaxID=159749 RepID=K0QZ44_THAOC|nr:hypothetical protein THAOC_36735 [Thalassiosira oceanica]|eukprot:EJK44708.1 hypothetical protein THAOC_36735 [Thalassiosira oceanica]